MDNGGGGVSFRCAYTRPVMALFFDSQWFDARLGALGLKRADLAAALGLAEPEIAEVWKDQRELTVANVRLIAGLLDVAAKEVASRAGVSTPVPPEEARD